MRSLHPPRTSPPQDRMLRSRHEVASSEQTRRALSVRRSAPLLTMIMLALWSTPAVAHCPNPGQLVAGNFRVWVVVNNVGWVPFVANDPHTTIRLDTTDIGWFESTLMLGNDSDGALWGAEGPWRATCVHLFNGVHSVIPFSPPNNFAGTVFLIDPGPSVLVPPGDGMCAYQIIPDPDECTDDGSGGPGGGHESGDSDCVVEYICIDIWNENTGTWDEYWCGAATVCG
jgi:hypothetical protein